ncbi:MAG: hypothetical protein JW873_01265 [Candidatus Saganbacteria bacterium]|nr:hypothetical protein [Candidatus Saganbacteria bacterium]
MSMIATPQEGYTQYTASGDASFAGATHDLANALDNIQTSLGHRIDELAANINTLASYGSDADISDMQGVKDGAVVQLQYAINEMEKAAESGASTFTKAENISKQTFRTLAGA